MDAGPGELSRAWTDGSSNPWPQTAETLSFNMGKTQRMLLKSSSALFSSRINKYLLASTASTASTSKYPLPKLFFQRRGAPLVEYYHKSSPPGAAIIFNLVEDALVVVCV